MILRRSALATLVGVLALLSLAATADAERPRCNGMHVLCERTFDEVVLAGTHNSMSANSLGWRFPNHMVAIPRQLRSGVRALLIDTHYGRRTADGTVLTDDDGSEDRGKRGLYLCHRFCELGASQLGPVLSSIRRWVRRHPGNVLLIENEDYVKSAVFARAMERTGLLDYVYQGEPGPWPTLAEMIESRQQIVMLADRDAKGDPPWYHPTYEGIMQETPFTFRQTRELIRPEYWPASCQPNRGGSTGALFLMNHWSPPIQPREPDLPKAARVNASDVIVGRAQACAEIRGQLPSVVAVDQFTAGDVLKAVRRLNRLHP